jgi:hypothetical protein
VKGNSLPRINADERGSDVDREIAEIGEKKFFFTAKDAKGAKEQNLFNHRGREGTQRKSAMIEWLPKSERQRLTADQHG